jgi:TonB family protein
MLVEEQTEYHVVLLDNLAPTPSEWKRAIAGTAAVHLALLLVLISIPRDNANQPKEERPRQITRLYDPPTRLTQKAPNKAPLTKEISVAPQIEAPQFKPQPKPQAKPIAPPKRFAPPPAEQAAKRAPTPVAPQEPPKLKATQVPPPVQIASSTTVSPPIPPAPPPSQPKITLENVPPPPTPGRGTGLLKVPTGSVQEAVQALSQSNNPARVIPDQAGGPAARKQPSIDIEIMSDTNGVDMKPYILRVLQSVRRNWLSVYPESARLGLRGQVVVQFAIAPDGVISKTVFISQAPSDALNRAVISAFSMSNPLPALPPEFKGSRIVLQFTFSYNMPK